MTEHPPGALSAQRPILARVGRRCIDELGADFATIAATTGPSGWTPAYVSDPIADRLDQLAFTVGEGPCVDAVQSHAVVLVPDLSQSTAAARWPAWTGAALELGIGSVAAFPIQAGAFVAGALTTYRRTARSLDPAQIGLALRLADAALLGLLDLAAGLGSAPDDSEASALLRAEVHQAAGMIMVQAGVPISAALSRLRGYSFASGRPLAEVANEVVSRRLRFEPDRNEAE